MKSFSENFKTLRGFFILFSFKTLHFVLSRFTLQHSYARARVGSLSVLSVHYSFTSFTLFRRNSLSLTQLVRSTHPTPFTSFHSARLPNVRLSNFTTSEPKVPKPRFNCCLTFVEKRVETLRVSSNPLLKTTRLSRKLSFASFTAWLRPGPGFSHLTAPRVTTTSYARNPF